MKKVSLVELTVYILVRILSLFFVVLPLRFVLFLGRIIGVLVYYLDIKHKNLAYTHIKLALSKDLLPSEIKRIVEKLFMNLGQNFIETLRLPKIDMNYIKKYIQIEGEEFLKTALREGKGVIIFGSHFGSWELPSAVVPLLGYKFSIFARQQHRFNSLNSLLNRWRESKGCKVITTGEETKEAVYRLKRNEVIGLVGDHGGKEGVWVNFFEHPALTPTGAIRFGYLLDTPLLPAYITRLKGPYHKIKILPPLILEKTEDPKRDLVINLEKANRILEGYIKRYPDQYLWFYKRWKYSNQRNLLVLSDGRVGHQRQIEALIKIIREIAGEKNLEIREDIVKLTFKNRSMKRFQAFCTALASKYHCRGCLWCLKRTLDNSVYEKLRREFADIVISCGTETSYVNFVISSECRAKSIHIMRPGVLSTKRFDLVIIPKHDRPPKRRNLVITQGALNLIDKDYLKEQTEKLLQIINYNLQTAKLKIGLLIGGDTKNFKLSVEIIRSLIEKLKKLLSNIDGEIFITTSRRTSKELETLIKKEFSNEPRCRLLVIANERNIPEAVGGILGLCDIIVISPESISMVSEAISSEKYVIVFKLKENLPKKHRVFLRGLEEEGFIKTTDIDRIDKVILEIKEERPEVRRLSDYFLVKEAVRKIL